MRKLPTSFFFALCLLVSAPAPAEETSGGGTGLYLSAGAEGYSSSLSPKTHYGVRPVFGLHYDLLHNLVALAELTAYKIPVGPADLKRNNFLLGLGYYFLEKRLRPVIFAGTSSAEYQRFQGDSSTMLGARIAYLHPIFSKGWRLQAEAGWAYLRKVTIQRDTGIPRTNDPFENSLCSFITLGLADGCGNIYERITIPQSRELSLNLSLGYAF